MGARRLSRLADEPAAAPGFLWHDYECFGADTRRDRPSQFACWRTTVDLEPVGEPQSWYCQPPPDYLPDPYACVLTGLFPDTLSARGLPEPEFAAAVQEQMAQAGTCIAGYNSLRFDDEVSRHLFWRNLYDPYAHEWAHGNSRFDLIDVLRMAYALRPQGLHWAFRDDGAPSFKLERLAAANHVEQRRAHDATDDVIALVGLAQKLKEAQPRLWKHALRLRSRAVVGALLDLEQPRALLHVSQRFASARGCLAVVWPLLRHPQVANRILLVDLDVDPARWADWTAEELAERWFAPRDSETERPPLKAVQLNRVPMLAPLSVLDGVDTARIQLDLSRCLEHLEALRQRSDLATRVAQALRLNEARAPAIDPDADSALYDGFVDDTDRRLAQQARDGDPAAVPPFGDARLRELWWRRQARWFGQSLAPDQQLRWRREVAQRLHAGQGGWRTFERFASLLDDCRRQAHGTPVEWQQLEAWAASRAAAFPAP